MERNYVSLSDKQLSELINDAKKQYKECVQEYKDKINVLLSEFLPSWYVSSLYEESLRFERKSETEFYKNGSPRTYEIQLYHGRDYWTKGDRNRFELNVSAMGSFDILGNNDIKQYYVACGTILSNNVFNLELDSLLTEFYQKIRDINNYLEDLNREEEIREDERKDKEIREANKQNFNLCITSFAENLEDKYVVLKKVQETYANCYYRKSPFTLETPAVCLSDAECMKRVMQIENRYAEFKIIPANKVKFN